MRKETISREQKFAMLEYLVSKLREGNQLGVVVSQDERIVSGIETHSISVDERRVLLVDDTYTGAKFSEAYYHFARENQPFGVVIYKGGPFFRAAMPRIAGKTKGRGSLVGTPSKEMNKIILVSEEELFLVNKGRTLQYYQPKSERLEEGVVSYDFNPVVYRYEEGSVGREFQGPTRASTKRFIWTKRGEVLGEPLMLDGNYLKKV